MGNYFWQSRTSVELVLADTQWFNEVWSVIDRRLRATLRMQTDVQL